MFSLSVASFTIKISVCQTESSESYVSQKLSQECESKRLYCARPSDSRDFAKEVPVWFSKLKFNFEPNHLFLKRGPTALDYIA